MCRCRRLAAWSVAGLLCLAGCASSEFDHWSWPWTKPSPLAEEYCVPPPGDQRYSGPPKLPKSVIQPKIPKRDSGTNQNVPPGRFGGPAGIGPVGGRRF